MINVGVSADAVLRLGYWRDGFGVQVSPEFAEAFGQCRVRVRLTHDRRFVLIPHDVHGPRLKRQTGPSARKAKGFVFGCVVSHEHIEWPWPEFVMPRFENYNEGLDWSDLEEGYISQPLPLDHELPWPRMYDHRSSMTHEELLAQCRLRIRSALAAGLKGTFDEVGVPRTTFDERLRGGIWPKMLQEVRGA